MKRKVSLGLCLTLSLVLVFGSPLSFTETKTTFAINMPDAPATQDAITVGSAKGDGDEDQGDNNDDQEDDPATQEAIAAGGGSEEDDDEESSGQSRDNNNNNDKEDNRNPPVTSDTGETGGPDCPENQEPGLFGSCLQQTCSNYIGSGSAAPILSDENNKCANSQYADPSTRD